MVCDIGFVRIVLSLFSSCIVSIAEGIGLE